jgi:hypothetical protein
MALGFEHCSFSLYVQKRALRFANHKLPFANGSDIFVFCFWHINPCEFASRTFCPLVSWFSWGHQLRDNLQVVLCYIGALVTPYWLPNQKIWCFAVVDSCWIVGVFFGLWISRQWISICLHLVSIASTGIYRHRIDLTERSQIGRAMAFQENMAMAGTWLEFRKKTKWLCLKLM